MVPRSVPLIQTGPLVACTTPRDSRLTGLARPCRYGRSVSCRTAPGSEAGAIAVGAARHAPRATALPVQRPVALAWLITHVRGSGVNVVSCPPYCESAAQVGP